MYEGGKNVDEEEEGRAEGKEVRRVGKKGECRREGGEYVDMSMEEDVCGDGGRGPET